jgi:DNA-binding transcriptional MerR regulator
MTQGLQIGVVARETGLTVDAIQFYEKSGLLKRPPRSEGGFRLFRQKDLEDLRFVRKAQELGFSLNEVRELAFLTKRERRGLRTRSRDAGTQAGQCAGEDRGTAKAGNWLIRSVAQVQTGAPTLQQPFRGKLSGA